MMIFFMASGTLIGLSTSLWLAMWLGLEINSYFFLPLLKKSEFQFKYFFIQAMGSIFFVFSFYFMNNTLFITGLMMKISSFPFFFWIYPSLKWVPMKSIILFLTFQKVLPLCLMLNIVSSLSDKVLIMIFFFMNSISGYLGVKNKSNMVDIILFSSIYQISWVIMTMSLSKYIFKMYFMFYIMTVFFVMILSKNFLSYNNKSNFIFLWFLFFLISGFPPSSIFLLKVSVISNVMFFFSYLSIFMNLILVVGFMLNYLKLIFSTVHNKMSMPVWSNLSSFYNSMLVILLLFTLIMM